MFSIQLIVGGKRDSQPLEYRVEVAETIDLASYSTSVRTSPLYAIAPTAAKPPAEGSDFWVGLFEVDDFVSAVSYIPDALAERSWFSLGIASIVLISDSGDDLATLLTALGSQVKAYEYWPVENGTLALDAVTWNVSGADDLPIGKYLIPCPDDLPDDIRIVVEELSHNLHVCVVNANRHSEALLSVLDGVSHRGRLLLEALKGQLSDLGRIAAGELEESALQLQRTTNTFVDQIIAINSTLAYVYSQAFHGGIPTLIGSESLVRHHSLLGIGLAHRGVARLVGFIENGFSQFPTLLAAERLLAEPLTVELRQTGELRLRKAPEGEWPDLDDYLRSEEDEDEEEEPSCPKLTYFSSRYGFSEGPGIVTLASQSIGLADTTRWSLMTVTHEMMHAHFDAILAQLLTEDEPESDTKKIFESAASISTDPNQNPVGTYCSAGEAFKAQLLFTASLLQSGRVRRAEAEAHWTASDKLEFETNTASSPEEYLGDLIENRKIFEECVVHSLDLFYFYQGNSERYLRALWTSWATVPGVVENLEFYILRSLVCVGYSIPGEVFPDRFDGSIDIFNRALSDPGSETDPSSLIIAQALAFLENEKNQDLLKMLFGPLVLACESYQRFFFSDKLRVFFESGDVNVVTGASGVDYAMETGELSGDSVKNPLAFLADRLRRRKDGEPPTVPSEEYCSAWVLAMLGGGN